MEVKATQNQINKINKIISFLGKTKVSNYITHVKRFENTDINNLSKSQAQKIITGLGHKIPNKPILNVYGRNF